MKFNIHQYRAIKAAAADDETLLDDLKTERNTLARAILTDPEYGKEIYSGGGNGTTFSAQVNHTNADRLTYLQTAIKIIEDDIPPTSRSIARFC